MNFVKFLFFLLVVKPFIYIVLGVNIKNGEKFPLKGPAVIVANHTSHVDALLLMSLFPICSIHKIKPIAAADYFFNTPIKRFIFKTLLGAIPITRKNVRTSAKNLFAEMIESLNNKDTLIIFPEGTRSMDKEMHEFKQGIAHLAKLCPEVPFVPVYIHGAQDVMPKWDALLVPRICEMNIGDKIYYDNSSSKDFTEKVKNELYALKKDFDIRKKANDD